MRSVFFVLMFALLVAPVATAETPESKIAPELLVQLEQDSLKSLTSGSEPAVFRVVVDLRQRAFTSDAEMTRAFATPQAHQRLMADIASLQDGVLRSMAGKADRGGFQ
ncbi:MAG: hypothetical protein AAFX50_06340, partial [Acidobacteriota bacterium]